MRSRGVLLARCEKVLRSNAYKTEFTLLLLSTNLSSLLLSLLLRNTQNNFATLVVFYVALRLGLP
jgi:hypothetical protein